MRTKRTVSCLAAVLLSAIVVSAVDGDKAEYIGGTITELKEKTEGKFDTSNPTDLIFTPNGKNATAHKIPYASIKELEYGQKAGRRVAVAVLVSPIALFSKKRKHYFTITFVDKAGTEQAAVFELGKDIVRPATTVVKTRSGKEITFQDDDAKKALGGGKDKEKGGK